MSETGVSERPGPGAPATRTPLARITPGRPLPSRAPEAALAGLCLLALVFLLIEGRGQTFFYDEWNLILYRRGISFETLLLPHGGDHLSLVPVVIYKALLQVFGLGTYLPYRFVLLGLHIACGVLLYIYARRRLGVWLALLPAALLLFLGSAWEDLLWSFQIGFLFSVATGLCVLLALDARPRRDALACGLLILSLASSGVGIPFVVVTLIDIALDEQRRWRRAWVVAVPTVLWVVWYAIYGGEGRLERDLAGPPDALRYGLDMAAAGVGGLGGLGLDWGRSLLMAAVVGLVIVLGRSRSGSARIVALACGIATFWLMTGVSRAAYVPPIPPDSSRYVYVSAVFLLLIGAVALNGLRPSPRQGAVLAVVAAVLCTMNLGELSEGADGLRKAARQVKLSLAAVEVARDRVRSDAVLEARAPQVAARPYLDAVASFGSPATPLREVRRMDESARTQFDRALVSALRLAPAPAPRGSLGGPAPRIEFAANGRVGAEASCAVLHSRGSGAAIDVSVPRGRVLVIATAQGPEVQVRLRRLAAEYDQQPLFTVPGRRAVRIAIPPDRMNDPWHLRVSPQQDVRVCGAT